MKRIIAVLIINMINGISISAQESEISAQLNVSAIVSQSIELITVNSINLGNTQPGQELIYVNPINNSNSGFMIAIGTPDAEFRLDYEPDRVLTNTNGSGTLSFTYEISGNFIEEQSSSELLRNENRNLRFNSEGRYYFWVGGEVNLTNATPGSYEGDFTIEIDYI